MSKPQAAAKYSLIRKAGNTYYLAGQIGLKPGTLELVSDNFGDQLRQVMENIKAILADENLSFNDVMKVTIYLKNIEDYPVLNEIYAEYITATPPARAAFAVKNLPLGALVEIEAIAYKE